MARFWARWEAGRPIPNNNKLVATGSHKGGRVACYTPCVIAIFTQYVSLCYCVRAWFRVTLCWLVCRHVLVGVSWWHTMGTCYEGFELAENVWIPKTFKTSARDFIWLGWEESLTIWFTYSQSRLALHVVNRFEISCIIISANLIIMITCSLLSATSPFGLAGWRGRRGLDQLLDDRAKSPVLQIIIKLVPALISMACKSNRTGTEPTLV